MIIVMLLAQAVSSSIVFLAALRALSCAERMEISFRTAAAFALCFASASGFAKALNGTPVEPALLVLLLGVACWVGWMIAGHNKAHRAHFNLTKG